MKCTEVSQEAGKVVWYSHLVKNFPQFIVIHTVKGFSIDNEVQVDVFLEFHWIIEKALWSPLPLPFPNPDCTFGNFPVHELLKPNLKDFEHYLASMWSECNCVVVLTFFGIVLLWNRNENWPFSSPEATDEFTKFAGILSTAL